MYIKLAFLADGRVVSFSFPQVRASSKERGFGVFTVKPNKVSVYGVFNSSLTASFRLAVKYML